jgi:hypothetical protein
MSCSSSFLCSAAMIDAYVSKEKEWQQWQHTKGRGLLEVDGEVWRFFDAGTKEGGEARQQTRCVPPCRHSPISTSCLMFRGLGAFQGLYR